MRAEDLRWTEIVSRDEKGFLNFGSKRIVIIAMDEVIQILDDIQRFMGPGYNYILSRFGYNIGMATAVFLGNQYDFDSPEERNLNHG